MNGFKKSLVALVCVAGLSLALAAHVVADSVDVSPNSAVGNTPITVKATGFDETGNMAVFFYLDHPAAFEQPGYWGVCFGSGSCQIQASMPFEAGPHTVYAYGYQNAFAQEQFTVLTPVFMLDHSCLTNGTPLIMTGYNFAQGANINLYLDGDQFNGTFLGQGHTDSAGRFAKEITLGLSNGSHTITAYNGVGEIAASQAFLVGSNDCPRVGQAANLTCGSTGCPTITRPGQPPQQLNPNDPIYFGDLITTPAGGKVNLLFLDDTQFTIGQNAKLTIDEYVYDPNSNDGSAHYTFLQGAFVYTSGLMAKHDDNVRVKGVDSCCGIRGTEFITRLDPCSTTQEIYLIEGELAITPDGAPTNTLDAPLTILYDGTNLNTSALTQATYDALKAQITQTNPVTFADWQAQYFGCTNGNSSADANADPDGDGQNNMAEFLTGTDPTNAASAFRILSVTRTNADLNVTWFAHAGVTNVVEASTDLTGSYTNLSPNLIITGVTNSSDVVTNYVDPGAATNVPARYYRIRLVP